MNSVIPLPHNPCVGTLFSRVRDAATLTEGVTTAERIAVLEMVKAEIVRDALETIHG